MKVLYLNDDTSEIVNDDNDFQRMLYERLGTDVEEYFVSCLEMKEIDLDELTKERDYYYSKYGEAMTIVDSLDKEILELKDEVEFLHSEIVKLQNASLGNYDSLIEC